MPTQMRHAGDSAALYQDEQQAERWRQDERNGPSSSHQSQQADPLTALLLYLADGYETKHLASRAAALLLLVRPDLVGAKNYRQMALKLGVSPASLIRAVRLLRETVPLRGGLAPSQTSQSRLLSLGQIRARRRLLWLQHLERVADARKIAIEEIARQRVRKTRARDASARAVERVLADIAAKHAELDSRLVIACRVPDETDDTRGLDPLERVRRDISARKGAGKGVAACPR